MYSPLSMAALLCAGRTMAFLPQSMLWVVASQQGGLVPVERQTTAMSVW